MSTPVTDRFGVLSAEMRRSPYGAYERMRAEGSVVFCEAWGSYCVVRHAEVLAGFRDPRLSSSRTEAFTRTLSAEARTVLRPLTRNLESWALFLDPPDHARLRGLIVKAFTPRVVEGLRPKVLELSRLLIDDAKKRAASSAVLDVVRDVAAALPVIVIGDLLGLSREDRHKLKAWSDALATLLGVARPTPELAAAAVQAMVQMEAYFRDAIAEKRRAPGDDLLTQLLRTEEAGTSLTEQELLSTCAMVLFGGHETTTNLIANGLACLLDHPAQLARLRAHPELGAGAVEEIMRFECPVQRMGRVASEDLELGGLPVPAGSRVHLIMGSAHRDPAAFESPDRLDVSRRDVRHLGFGFGAHYCVGAALGRMEAELALRELIALPGLAPAYDALAWVDNATIRGLETLPVRFEA